MAKTWTFKEYPQESKEKLEKLMEETKEVRERLDRIDEEIKTTDTTNRVAVKDLANRAIGDGNYLRKKLARLEAAATNEKGNRYMEIKLECSTSEISFADGAAKQEAEAFIGPLRLVRNIIESYVLSADSIVSTCRMMLHDSNREQATVEL
jgi:hypothetical protein